MSASSKEPFKWTDRLRRYFIEECAKEFQLGTATDSGFKTTGWTNIRAAFIERSGMQILKTQLCSQYSDYKKKYGVFNKLRTNSGFGWDDERKLPTAPDNTWAQYLTAHPKAKPYRYSPFPNLELAELLFGGQMATGDYALSSVDDDDIPRTAAALPAAQRRYNYDHNSSEDESSSEDNSEEENRAPVAPARPRDGPPTKRVRKASAADEARALLRTLVEAQSQPAAPLPLSPLQQALAVVSAPDYDALLANPQHRWCLRVALLKPGMAEVFLSASNLERVAFIEQSNAAVQDDIA